MILTSLDHTPGLLPDFDPAFAWLRTVANNPPPAGKVNIDGDRLFAIVEDKTADTVKNTPLVWETHRRYADIQYVARGVESHGWLNISHAPPTQTPYNDTQDAQFYEAPNASQHPAWFDVSAGHLAVYHPQDLHAPSQTPLAGPAVPVVKIIVKVLLPTSPSS